MLYNNKIIKLSEKEYEAYAAHDKQMPSFFLEQLKNGSRTVYLYQQNGLRVGEIALVTNCDDSDYTIPNQRAYLSRLEVSEAYRNHGIGGKLIDFICEKAKELKYTQITLGVYTANAPAMHLYHKKGFTILLRETRDELGSFHKIMKQL